MVDRRVQRVRISFLGLCGETRAFFTTARSLGDRSTGFHRVKITAPHLNRLRPPAWDKSSLFSQLEGLKAFISGKCLFWKKRSGEGWSALLSDLCGLERVSVHIDERAWGRLLSILQLSDSPSPNLSPRGRGIKIKPCATLCKCPASGHAVVQTRI